MMSFKHIAFPATGTQYPDVTGLQILQSRRVFAVVDYTKRRKTTIFPYGRSGVQIILTMTTFNILSATIVSAVDVYGNQCCLPDSFQFITLYRDGSKRVCQTVAE